MVALCNMHGALFSRLFGVRLLLHILLLSAEEHIATFEDNLFVNYLCVASFGAAVLMMFPPTSS